MSNICISVITKVEKNNGAKFKNKDPVSYNFTACFRRIRPKRHDHLLDHHPLPSKSLAIQLHVSECRNRDEIAGKNASHLQH